MYGFVAVGFAIVFNSSDVINFALGDFVMLGGVAYVKLYDATESIVVAALGAIVLGTIVGGIVYLGPLRAVRRASVMRILILTLGISTFLQGVMLVWVGPNPLDAAPFSSGKPVEVLDAKLTPQAFWIFALLAIVGLGLWLFFNRTRVGLKVIACAIDRRGAALMGINVSGMVLVTWLVSSGLAALGGVMVSPLISANYAGGLAIALNGFAAAALSGMGRIGGALVCGLIIGLVSSLSATFLPQDLLGFQQVIGIALTLVVLVIRPSGLFGGRAEARHTVEL